MSSDEPPEFDEVISDVHNNVSGQFSCPICHEFKSDDVPRVKAHISGSKDTEHEDLGWNYEEEIRETGEDSQDGN